MNHPVCLSMHTVYHVSSSTHFREEIPLKGILKFSDAPDILTSHQAEEDDGVVVREKLVSF